MGLGDAHEAVDISWDHFTAPAQSGGGSQSVNPTARLTSVSTELGSAPFSNVGAAGGNAQYFTSALAWKDLYETAGATYGLTFHVTNSSGTAAANTAVHLHVNTGYSGSTAVSYTHLTLPTIYSV